MTPSQDQTQFNTDHYLQMYKHYSYFQAYLQTYVNFRKHIYKCKSY
jgi:hypothetical protein